MRKLSQRDIELIAALRGEAEGRDLVRADPHAMDQHVLPAREGSGCGVAFLALSVLSILCLFWVGAVDRSGIATVVLVVLAGTFLIVGSFVGALFGLFAISARAADRGRQPRPSRADEVSKPE